MTVSVPVQKLLCAKYGNVCAYPNCTTNLIVTSGGEERFFGEIAHIISGKEGGPRYDPALPSNLIDAEVNLLVMCERHHKEIDTFVDQWPTEKLRDLRREVLGQTAIGWKPWLPRLQAINYANPIRLGHLALLRGVKTTLPVDVPAHTPGLGAYFWVQAVLDELGRLDIEARRLTMEFDLNTLQPGELLVFDRQVRILHGARMRSRQESLTGDLNTDPLVYFSRGGIRLIMPIDPQWITTSTAFSDFAQGAAHLAGLCQIKRRVLPGHPPASKKRWRGQFLASPLVLGIGEFPHDDDLDERTVHQVWDTESETVSWVGPWSTRNRVE